MWAAGQQTITMGLSAVLGIVLVRALPPYEYGIYSYAISLCAIGTTIMTAGLSGLAVKELVNHRERNAAAIAGLVVVREAFALIGYGLIALVSLTSGNQLSIAATLLASIALFGRALDVPEAWFLSHLRSRRTATLRVSYGVALFALRLAVLAWLPNIWLLLGLYAVEGIVVSVAILVRYSRDRESPGWTRPDIGHVVMMLKQSIPLMLSGIANQVNLRSDVIVIQAMLGATAVGVYSAASRLSEIAYFLPVVFMNSTLPVLLTVKREKGSDSVEYKAMLQRSYDQAFWVGILVAAVTAVGGSLLISLLFGERYAESIPVLQIHVLACPFIFMAAVYSKWIISEGLLWSSLTRHLAGAAANVVLNILLIPSAGLVGSAVATVASYAAASYLASFFGRQTRPAAIQMTLAIVAPVRYLARAMRTERDDFEE